MTDRFFAGIAWTLDIVADYGEETIFENILKESLLGRKYIEQNIMENGTDKAREMLLRINQRVYT